MGRSSRRRPATRQTRNQAAPCEPVAASDPALLERRANFLASVARMNANGMRIGPDEAEDLFIRSEANADQMRLSFRLAAN